MANEKNLKPFDSNQSREEAKKNGRKGGIASGESKRAKKTLRESLTAALDAKTSINGEETSIKDAMMRSLVVNAVKNNDLAAIKYIAELIGEAPTQRIEVTGKDGKDIIQKDLSREEAKEFVKELGKEYGWDSASK